MSMYKVSSIILVAGDTKGNKTNLFTPGGRMSKYTMNHSVMWRVLGLTDAQEEEKQTLMGPEMG